MTPVSQVSAPAITIVLPVFNDEAWIARALESCTSQTLGEIEIIVVDDASTDSTAQVVESFCAIDDRITLIRMQNNGSALRARRVGIEAASGEYVLFVDGDDEIVPEACATTITLARQCDADLVGFGSVVVSADGTTGSHYENSMQPRHKELIGASILETIFPVGENAQGQLWRYLFRRSILLRAYESLPPSLALPRMNDLPIAFLSLMYSDHYISTNERLYRYFFRRGASGHDVTSWSDYLFNAGSIDSIDAIQDAVYAEDRARQSNDRLLDVYQSVRFSVIGRILNYVYTIASETMRSDALNWLADRVGGLALAIASSDFCPRALPLLAEFLSPATTAGKHPEHVLLRTGNLRTGGVQGVVVAQAAHLTQAGVKVTVVLDSEPVSAYSLPDDVDLLQLEGNTRGEKIAHLVNLCVERSVDAVIDHHIFYNDRWPYFALGLAGAGVPMIGWIHNFALRPLLDEVNRLSFLDKYLPTLSSVVVLSEADVAYWKMRGVSNVVYLPNPPSPLAKQIEPSLRPRSAPNGAETLQIVWWGRLQQRTKQVLDLIDVAVHLRDSGIDFAIKIIGPDGPDLSVKQVRTRAKDRGVSDKILLLGQLHGSELIDAIQGSHVYVSTSIIEGYPLALVEAQAFGLPIVMYDLPWLEFIRNNSGALTVAQGDRGAIARALISLAENPDQYSKMSDSAISSVRSEMSHDLATLYSDLLKGTLSNKYSPSPSLSSMQLILSQNIMFIERLDRIHRRELKRKDSEFSRRYRDLEQRRESLPVSRPKKYSAPKMPKLRAVLQRFIPATMRQTGYYAKHQFLASRERHEELVANQAKLGEQIARLESRLNNRGD